MSWLAASSRGSQRLVAWSRPAVAARQIIAWSVATPLSRSQQPPRHALAALPLRRAACGLPLSSLPVLQLILALVACSPWVPSTTVVVPVEAVALDISGQKTLHCLWPPNRSKQHDPFDTSLIRATGCVPCEISTGAFYQASIRRSLTRPTRLKHPVPSESFF